ncbi:recombinase family protein [Actinomadura sp. KC216]|uniref:recombinase family protein n=1 Tax=Actinomadura sp. KC216 TaxID=2530370 RepID=UPI00104435B6|nr:recombinase family protein [Actinomadura sp. KC216]TDB80184.1 recombinase family protein [Actinomadura sp. KC216]
MSLAAAFVRVSTGSQDETSQVKAINRAARERGITIVKTFRLKGYSASKGTQEPALREAIADIQRGEYETLIVTESSRLDRREDLDAQAEILLVIRSAGGDVVSLTEPNFGKTDFAGRIITLVAQHANAEKSKTVKSTSYRGMTMVRDNKALHGKLPTYWKTKGKRYAKQAYCADPQAVNDVYVRIARGESVASVGRAHDLYNQSIRNLIRFEAHHTGVIECSYTYEGVTEKWIHEVTPVVDSALWWSANKVLDANKTSARVNKGGRPIRSPATWLSGILPCPGCGGKLYINASLTPAGNPRTPKLYCAGTPKKRLSCKRFNPCDALPVIELVEEMFGGDTTEILAFQRVAGNAHELGELKASLRKIQARLSATEDDDKLDALITERKAIKARIEEFVVVPDNYDYAPTGQTVAERWISGDESVKRKMLRAVRESLGMILALHDGQPRIVIGTDPQGATAEADGIVDLGDGLCFRRHTSQAA